MGKKSLTKSTSKKKTTKKKTTTAKSASAKTDAKKTSDQKNASKKKTGSKKPTLKSLRKKDFGTRVPETLYAPEPQEEQFQAPPVIETTDKETARHLRELLDKKFEAAVLAKAAPKKKAAAQSKKKQPAKTVGKKKTGAQSGKKKKAPTTAELIKKQFDRWQPEDPFVPETASDAGAFAAPPFSDKADEENFREILFREFDLSKVTPKPPPEPEEKPAPEPEPDAEKPAEPAADKPMPAIAELLARKFDAWQPKDPFVPETASDAGAFAAPPFSDKADEENFREILFREFDLSKVTPKPPPEPEEKPAPEPEPDPEAEKPAEPEQEAAPEAAPSDQEPAEPPKEEPAEAVEAAPKTEAQAPDEASTEAPQPDSKPEPEAIKAETSEKKKPEKGAEKASSKAAKPKQKTPPPSSDKGRGGEPPQPPGPTGPTEPPQPPEPMNKNLKRLIIGIAAVFALIIVASALNSGNYYVRHTDDGVEVWKGDFSPRGKDKVVSLKDMTPPEGLEGRVSKLEAYSLPFDYYMAKAQKISEKSGVPDFEAIRKNLEKARKYAVSSKQMQRVRNRLHHIEFTLLLNKADMAASQETAQGYEKALNHLREARDLATTPSQRELVVKETQKIRAAQKALHGTSEKKKAPKKTQSPAEKPQDKSEKKPGKKQEAPEEGKASEEPGETEKPEPSDSKETVT